MFKPGVFFFCLIVINPVFGVESELWQPATLPAQVAGRTLRAIFFSNEKTGWVVGDQGLCLNTEDGGATWRTISVGSDATLRGIRFKNNELGFICGDGDTQAPRAGGHVVSGKPLKSGLVLATADRGKTWSKYWLPTNFEIWCIEAASTPVLQVGIGCEDHPDGDIMRSSDGGKTWNWRRCYRSLSDVRELEAGRWAAVGSSVSVGFTGIVTDPTYLAKECRALFSRDGGETWLPAKGANGQACLRGLFWNASNRMLWAVGDQGLVLSSANLGENWSESGLKNIASDLRSIAGTENGMVLLAVGTRGVFLLSTDGGKSWRASWVVRPENLFAAACNGETMFVVGERGTMLTCAVQTLSKAQTLPMIPRLQQAKNPSALPLTPAIPATPAQRARARVGDFLSYRMTVKGPMGMNFEFEEKQSVTAVQGDEAFVRIEVIKGEPPKNYPKLRESRLPLAALESFEKIEVNSSWKEKVKNGELIVQRIANEELIVSGKKLDCVVLQTAPDQNAPGGNSAKKWFCVEQVPLNGLVKTVVSTPLSLPNGKKANMEQTQELSAWGRGAK